MPLLIEVVGGFKQYEEFVGVEHVGRPPCDRFSGASPAGRVSIDPSGVFGLVEDRGEGPQRLVDRIIG